MIDNARTDPAGYRAALEDAAWRDEPLAGVVRVSGGDAVSFLHNVLTNDIQSLEAGGSRYAAYLTPQGRMIADMDVIRRQDDLLLAVGPGVSEDLAERLDRSLFTEDVRVEDCSPSWGRLTVYGPAGARRIADALEADSRLLEALGGDAHVDTGELLVLRDDRLGTPAFHVLGPREACDRVQSSLTASGVEVIDDEAYTALRIEAGIPLFGVDMTTATIPLEAGIEHRAISMTKGCYVGQEVIVRILHRGHGRVARRLVGLVVEGEVPARDTAVFAGGESAGAITSAAWSPRLSKAIAMGYVSRDVAVAGNVVSVGSPEGPEARVAAFPLV